MMNWSFTFWHSGQQWRPILVREGLHHTSDQFDPVVVNSTGLRPENVYADSQAEDYLDDADDNYSWALGQLEDKSVDDTDLP